jgi:uncharacterized repeat protein (TIGR01451 family)
MDMLPAGLSLVSASPSQGTYNSTTGLWAVGTATTSVPQTLLVQALVVTPNAVTNTATISHADQFDPNTGNNSSSATAIPQQADLAIGKTVSNAQPSVGETIMYTVTLTNNGPATATNVTVMDLLPAGLSFVSATPSQGTYSNGTGVWTVGTITTSGAQTLFMQALVVSPNPGVNTASISHADQFDPNVGNNSASVALVPTQADLALGKIVNDPDPNVGDTITFTVTLTNNGPGTATGIVVTDLLPAGLTAVSASPSQGSYVFGTGLWTVGTLTNATSATLLVQATVVSANAQTNTAAISAADQFDPNPGNNFASATVTPQVADLALTQTVSDSLPHLGDTITLTITLNDHGPSDASNVMVSDLLPVGLAPVSATPSQGSYSFASGLWTVGAVTTSIAQTLLIRATVVSVNPQTNTATISHADQFDPNVANNSASASETPQ